MGCAVGMLVFHASCLLVCAAIGWLKIIYIYIARRIRVPTPPMILHIVYFSLRVAFRTRFCLGMELLLVTE